MEYNLKGYSPVRHENSYVAPGAKLIGQVELHEYSSIWFNAVLRGDNEKVIIGKGSNVQDGAIVHVDPGYPVKVGENVTVGHNVTLHGCTVEDGVLIGMGATVLNGAVIGSGSIVGAGALVPEGKRIEPGVLAIGVPAKVVRKLTVKETSQTKDGAEHYVNNSNVFRSTLKEKL